MKSQIYLAQARAIINWYREGSDLTEEQIHVLHDCALEHGQILGNVVHMHWFEKKLAENIEALSL